MAILKVELSENGFYGTLTAYVKDRDGYFLYDVNLIRVYKSEFDLDAGRFVNFSKVPLMFPVTVVYDKSVSMIWSDWFAHIMSGMEQISGKWNFTVNLINVNVLAVTLTFEQEQDAVWFKLSHG